MAAKKDDDTKQPIERAPDDLGVPMLPGDPSEPQGPEDALGEGPTRGDYRDRIGSNSYQPHTGMTPQRPRTEEIGDVPGEKGGVTTSSEATHE